jgi:hypothetical protein
VQRIADHFQSFVQVEVVVYLLENKVKTEYTNLTANISFSSFLTEQTQGFIHYIEKLNVNFAD